MNSIGRSRRRRTLRPTRITALVEGSVSRAGADHHVTVEIAGGPPRTIARVFINGRVRERVVLDGCGTAVVDVATDPDDSHVEIAVEEIVLLAGDVPAPPALPAERQP